MACTVRGVTRSRVGLSDFHFTGLPLEPQTQLLQVRPWPRVTLATTHPWSLLGMQTPRPASQTSAAHVFNLMLCR